MVLPLPLPTSSLLTCYTTHTITIHQVCRSIAPLLPTLPHTITSHTLHATLSSLPLLPTHTTLPNSTLHKSTLHHLAENSCRLVAVSY